MNALAELLERALWVCPICQHEPPKPRSFPFCPECWESRQHCPPFCETCGRIDCSASDTIEGQLPCKRPWKETQVESFHAAYLAIGSTHRILKYWKRSQSRQLDPKIIRFPEAVLSRLKSRPLDLLVPLPQSVERSWKLGGNPALRIGGTLSKSLGIPLQEVLEKSKASGGSKSQAMRNLFERSERKNPRFKLKAKSLGALKGKRVLLVDDWMTSGQTLEEAARVLKTEAQVSAVTVAVLALRPKLSKWEAKRAFT